VNSPSISRDAAFEAADGGRMVGACPRGGTRLRVVVVEDEVLTRRAIALALRQEGFSVSEAADAVTCRAVLETVRADVIILDLGLPGVDGLTLARELRAAGDAGLIVATREASHEARIQALDTGADDYLVKPIHYGELAARIRSVMRRRGLLQDGRKRLAGWTVDLKARTVMAAGPAGELDAGLTRGEFDVLARLIEADGKIVGRELLVQGVSRKPEDADLRSVDVLVSRLRRKLAGAADELLIATAPGFGYRLTRPAESL
jgi:two-component system torCAD operon response regulator TorR